jgi:putative membrane protein
MWCGWLWVWPVLVVVGLLILAYLGLLLVRGRLGSSRGGSESGSGSSARRILDERYARGEIDEEEYRRRRTELLCDHEDAGMMATAHVYG